MTATSPTAAEYLATPNGLVSAANGIDYAYRESGEGHPWSFFSTSAETSTTGIPR